MLGTKKYKVHLVVVGAASEVVEVEAAFFQQEDGLVVFRITSGCDGVVHAFNLQHVLRIEKVSE
jgi:hypothetical protein